MAVSFSSYAAPRLKGWQKELEGQVFPKQSLKRLVTNPRLEVLGRAEVKFPLLH